jgi:hypothetical protein
LWIPYCSAEPEQQFDAICKRDGVGPGAVRNNAHFYDRSIGARQWIHSQADQFVHQLRNSASAAGATPARDVFLSHAASDEHIALTLKAEIERRIPGVRVFCSSDPIDLPPGTRWSGEIQEALKASTILILVASARGLERPWVWFECGTFWFSNRKIVPFCLGDIRKNALRPPLWELQAINGDEPDGLKTALESIASATGTTLVDSLYLSELAEKLKELDREADALLRHSAGWLGAEWDGKFLAYDGPYQSLKTIEDMQFAPSMQDALAKAGYTVALYDKGHFGTIGEGGRFIQLTDRKSWRSRVVKGDMWLVGRPGHQ